ncbi:MAG: ABC transporter ATP-binding protein [Proteobacteria bacterium]|nr:ABC transporter ATP-binding protein [Pseudomonadota bacterium]
MIEIRGLKKHFGPIRAVEDVSFNVVRGEVLGFLGPNGAGKSTTMKMITGFLAPTAGSASVCGFDVERDPIEAKRRIGYLPEGAPAYPDMTAAAFLDFVGAIRGFDGASRAKRVAEAVERTQLADILNQPIDTLSKGFKRRVGLAQALLHDPEVLILDEPTDGLDPNQKHEVRGLIRSMAADKAIVISTHILEEVDAICSRAVVIARGRVLADGTPEALEKRSRWHYAVSFVAPAADLDRLRAALAAHPGVAGFERVDGEDGLAMLTAFPKAGRPMLADLGALARGTGIRIDEIREERGRLDEVFRAITTGTKV